MNLLPVIVPLALVPVIVVILVIGRRAQKKRAEDLRAAADTIGFAFQEHESVDQIKVRSDLPIFGHGHTKRASNVMTGRVGDQEVKLFDYQYTSGSGKESNTRRQTVALFPRGGAHLPDFVLAPENVLHKIGQAFGYRDIDFDSSPVFSSRYLLRGPDESAVRTAFSPDVLSFFEQHQGWHVEVQAGAVGIYRAGKRVDPQAIRELLEEARSVLNAVTRSWSA